MHLFGEEAAEDLAAVARALRRVIVVVSDARRGPLPGSAGRGSGIVWASDGTIVTNAHVATADRVAVRFADGRETSAQVVARDRRRDLALLRVDPTILDPLPVPIIGTPDRLPAGALVVALGHPLGVEHALALGVVYAAPNSRRSPYIAADIRLAPGNSGGPLADARGRIVGVNSMIVGGLGVAVSTEIVQRAVARLVDRPRVRSRDAA